MTWTALVPLKTGGERKSRLAGLLSPHERTTLSMVLFHHVTGVLRRHTGISEVLVLSGHRPPHWHGALVADGGKGLNEELRKVANQPGLGGMLVVHADLPLLSEADVSSLLEGVGAGVAIGPDRHATGTNALALRQPGGFDFAFGPNSFRRHRAKAGATAKIVSRQGVGLDIDTAADLAHALALGFRFQV